MTKKKESPIIIPSKDDYKVLVSPGEEMRQVKEVDYRKDETFPQPDDLDGQPLGIVVFQINSYLSQLSPLWKDRARMLQNFMIDQERRVRLLEQRVRKLTNT